MIIAMIGTTELIVIGGAILLLFGGKKIPGLMKSMGQGVKSFKQGLHEAIPEDIDEEKSESAEGKERPDNENGENTENKTTAPEKEDGEKQ